MSRITLTQLDELVIVQTHWSLTPDGEFLAHMPDAPDALVPAHLLSRLHPLLPGSLHLMLSEVNMRERGDKTIDGLYLAVTLDLLNSGGIEFVDWLGNKRLYSELTAIKTRAATDEVLIDGTLVVVSTFEHASEQVRFVTDYTRCDSIVKKSELENTYPGWEQRWLIAQELGLPIHEMRQHIFDKGPFTDQGINTSDIRFE